MEFLFLLGILGSLLPFALGGVAVYFAMKRARGVGLGGLGVDALYRQIAQAIQASHANGSPGGVPSQLLTQWQRMQSQMMASDRLSQERLDLKRSELMSMAAGAGLDIKL